jgi:hypothetical protein
MIAAPSTSQPIAPMSAQLRVVEDRRVLDLAGVEIRDQVVARHAQRLGRRVQVQTVAAFILDLRHQDRLALEGGSARDPVALGQHADDLGVRVLLDLPHQRAPVMLGHPVLRLDLDVGVDARLERSFLRRHLGRVGHLAHTGFDHLGVHSASSRAGGAAGTT